MGLILYIVSILLQLILVPLGILYGIAVSFYKRKFISGLQYANKKFLIVAISGDQFGNSVCRELFNSTLITKESTNRFGKINQTVSEVIGLNLLAGTLTKTGKFVNKLLDLIEKNHTIKAVESNSKT